MTIGTPGFDQPGLYRLSAAAAMAGLTPSALEAASKAGTIPIEIIRLSPRLAFVRASELNDFLKGNPHD